MLGDIGDEGADHRQRHQEGGDEAQRDLGPSDGRFACEKGRQMKN